MIFVAGVAAGVLLLISLVLGVITFISWATEGWTGDTWKAAGWTAVPMGMAVGLGTMFL